MNKSDEAEDVRKDVCSNLSLIYFKEKEYRKSIECANKVLIIDPKNLKGYYRRA